MSSTAFYLKYRPQALEEVIGQEVVKKVLLSSFQNNKLSHAYLFSGPRGTGKTSTARILAKMVNCERQETSDKRQEKTSHLPCNECSACLSITDGSNMDLIEIDAASNRGIEDIRSLRDKIKLAPTSAKKKVYIIDEVHMLTTEAFNALLKTLEEPPKHALFILATTDAGKLPQTILSRVQKLDFKLATTEELLKALGDIAKEEKINIDQEALEILAQKADGSFRDGVKLLDQLSSTGDKVTAKSIKDSLRSLDFDSILEFIETLNNKNAQEGLLLISRATENGIDIKALILSLMDSLRNVVFIKNGLGEQLVKKKFTEDKYEKLVKQSEKAVNEYLVKSLNILQQSLEQMKSASIPSLPLELAMVEICNARVQLEGTKEEKIEAIEKVSKEYKVPKVSEGNNTFDTSGTLQPSDTSNGSDSPDILKLKEKWTFVLETIRPFNFSLEALLRSINVTECTKDTVIMEVPYSFHQRILEAPKNRDLLESILSDILGRSIRVSTVLGARKPRREDVANIELAADDEIIRAAAEIFSSDTVN